MTGGSRLPGTPDDDGRDSIVLHVDMDCFYAACERRREPELRGEPVVVGMGYEGGETHGAVATASYEAREYGVESAQAIGTALERLPRKAAAEDDPDLDPEEAGHYRPVDMDYYEAVSTEVKEILHDSADVVREVSIDEAYLDVTDRTAWEVAEGFARHVKNRIDREVGVPASVGVAPNMSAAKIASDHDKPDGLVVVKPGEVRPFLDPLDVAELHGVGPVTARELREMGIETAGDLAAADREELRAKFGSRGAEMHRRARGEDRREVTPRGRPKSLSRESAFTEATDDAETKREQIRTLAEAVADRASRKEAMYRTIGIKAVTPPYDVNTRAKSLPGPVDDPELVEAVALELFEEFDDEPVRKVGVRVSNLSFADAEQASLGDGWDAADLPESDGAVDSGGSVEGVDASDPTAPSAAADGAVESANPGEAGGSTNPGTSASSAKTGASGGSPDAPVSLDDFESYGRGGSSDGLDDSERFDSSDGSGESADSPDPDADSCGDSDPEGQSSLADF